MKTIAQRTQKVIAVAGITIILLLASISPVHMAHSSRPLAGPCGGGVGTNCVTSKM